MEIACINSYKLSVHSDIFNYADDIFLEKFLQPVYNYVEEKKKEGMWDDYEMQRYYD